MHSIGDLRKRASYICEANFYAEGIAAELAAAAGATITARVESRGWQPCYNLHEQAHWLFLGVHGHGAEQGSSDWLATLHAMFFGHQRADAAVARGYSRRAPIGTWTRPDEHAAMPRRGWKTAFG